MAYPSLCETSVLSYFRLTSPTGYIQSCGLAIEIGTSGNTLLGTNFGSERQISATGHGVIYIAANQSVNPKIAISTVSSGLNLTYDILVYTFTKI